MSKKRRKTSKRPVDTPPSEQGKPPTSDSAAVFALLIRPLDISKGRPRPLRPLSEVEQEILAFDLEQRYRLAIARVLFARNTPINEARERTKSNAVGDTEAPQAKETLKLTGKQEEVAEKMKRIGGDAP